MLSRWFVEMYPNHHCFYLFSHWRISWNIQNTQQESIAFKSSNDIHILKWFEDKSNWHLCKKKVINLNDNIIKKYVAALFNFFICSWNFRKTSKLRTSTDPNFRNYKQALLFKLRFSELHSKRATSIITNTPKRNEHYTRNFYGILFSKANVSILIRQTFKEFLLWTQTYAKNRCIIA